MIIDIGALVALPDDPQQWVRDTMSAKAPPESTRHIGTMIKSETVSGWPMRLVGGRMSVANTTFESRLAAFYRFFEYGATAVVRYRCVELDQQLASDAKHILATAEPDFSSTIAAVHQLWEDAEVCATKR